MASTLAPQDTTLSPQQWRTFHLTGAGLDALTPRAPFLTEAAAALPEIDDLSIPFSPDALHLLHAAALSEIRKPARENFARLLVSFRDRLRTMLAVELHHSEEALTSQSLRNELGRDAGQFFDTEALSQALRKPAAGVRQMPRDRRIRIEQALAVIVNYLDEDQQAPACFQTTAAAALALCQRQSDRLSGVLRALQTARLEVDSAYDPALHNEQVARIGWHAAEAAELYALPPVLVYEPLPGIQQSLTELGRLLSSAVPVQIVVEVSGWSPAPDLGAIAMAFREAYVLSSSLATPRHLLEGLREMARSLRPAVAVVSTGEAADEPTARKQCALLLAARLAPLYRYNPDQGESLAQRFQWQPVSPTERLTPVDAAAFFASMRDQFRVLPDGSASDEHLPYVQTRDRRSIVFTASLLNQCEQRRRAWRLWEELAGIDSSIVDAAVERTRNEVQQAADARLDAALTQARGEGARNAVTRLVAVLTNPQASATVAASAPTPVAPPASAPAVPPVAPQAAPQPASPTGEAVDPYIDSFLCTSCNDCMKINSRLFLYNADKQAYISDPKLGTFAELVKAAEGCPGKCIHPGAPRPGDTTATPAWIAKAAKLG